MRFVIFMLAVTLATVARPAEHDAAGIRAASDAERAAVLAQDSVALSRLFADDLLVNSPAGDIQDKAGVIARLGPAGPTRHTTMERTIERIQIDGDIGVEMGTEVVADEVGPRAGQRTPRRFTNLYRYVDGEWRLFARHANRIVAGAP